jgi:hypothetical protein
MITMMNSTATAPRAPRRLHRRSMAAPICRRAGVVAVARRAVFRVEVAIREPRC